MRQTAKFDYYYGTQADTYSFYRIPKVLFTSPFFKGLSCEAKVSSVKLCEGAFFKLNGPVLSG